jgi:hypothetical protein
LEGDGHQESHQPGHVWLHAGMLEEGEADLYMALLEGRMEGLVLVDSRVHPRIGEEQPHDSVAPVCSSLADGAVALGGGIDSGIG